MRHRGIRIDRIVGSRLLSLGILAVLFLSLAALGKVCARHYGIEREIVAIEKEAGVLERDNVRLEKLVERATKDSFMEREARLKLGMKMPGEEVVVIVPREGEVAPTGRDFGKRDKKLPNYGKWLEYFLGK